MMTKDGCGSQQEQSGKTGTAPCLSITKLGIVSRDYRCRYKNDYRDFTHVLPDVLKLLDDKGCEAVLFSLFSIVPRESYDPRAAFKVLRNIKAVFLEEFQDKNEKRCAERYVVHHRTNGKWVEYDFHQVFGTLTGMSKKDIDDFVKNEMPKRVLGNCCVLLCGESNIVKYSPKNKDVHDPFRLLTAIPEETKIILNPIHDRMTRFEMKLKRQFLSGNNRWVISVWNIGKEDRNGNVRDGKGPAWTVFFNRKKFVVAPIENALRIEIGILDFNRA